MLGFCKRMPDSHITQLTFMSLLRQLQELGQNMNQGSSESLLFERKKKSTEYLNCLTWLSAKIPPLPSYRPPFFMMRTCQNLQPKQNTECMQSSSRDALQTLKTKSQTMGANGHGLPVSNIYTCTWNWMKYARMYPIKWVECFPSRRRLRAQTCFSGICAGKARNVLATWLAVKKIP